ncbi:hypothetical protein NAEGRDRAFT_81884 [Naegleria gruberi]|uniref:Uncharacterized protein n=1 Tax=Naegleria gruberi TaxID=5762 RepID=D2W006_NAEGR|nr:uncharacterized protein NAEGRDRAFT_81884 [Naegleria gruberi]EFC37662.1 hypothetical protein NAEGRDRAFT_81884 [Naegleria gruberi]|eukprot:XP_002670406.1 hypothetical protein NAEGRDRAFT_81884 [Naegleria gruberi strain NEG-M]
MLKRVSFKGETRNGASFIPVTVEPTDPTVLSSISFKGVSLASVSLKIVGNMTILTTDNSQPTLVSCLSTSCVVKSKTQQGCFFESSTPSFTPTYVSLSNSDTNSITIYPTKNFTGYAMMTLTCGTYTSSLVVEYDFYIASNGTLVDNKAPASSFWGELLYVYYKVKQVIVDFLDSFIFIDFLDTSSLNTNRVIAVVVGVSVLFVLITISLTICCCCVARCCCSGDSIEKKKLVPK